MSADQPTEPDDGQGELLPPPPPDDLPASGPQLARAALEAARGLSGQGKSGQGTGGMSKKRRSALSTNPQSSRRSGYTGSGPDARDPQPFGRLLRRLVADRGWERPAAEARVLGSWDRVVGPDISGHCTPVSLREGQLTLQAESTAWATQLRLLTPKLLAILASEVGAGVVTRLAVHGPAAPSWKKGPRTVRGRGPRDTYG